MRTVKQLTTSEEVGTQMQRIAIIMLIICAIVVGIAMYLAVPGQPTLLSQWLGLLGGVGAFMSIILFTAAKVIDNYANTMKD